MEIQVQTEKGRLNILSSSSHHFEHLNPLSQCPAASPLLVLLPASVQPGRPQVAAPSYGPCQPWRKPKWHSMLLTWTWPRTGCWRYLGSEAAYGWCSFACIFPFQINKYIHTYIKIIFKSSMLS